MHLAALQAAHRLAGVALDLRDPCLVRVLEVITSAHSTRPRRRAGAATLPMLRRLLGFRTALRRSALVGLPQAR